MTKRLTYFLFLISGLMLHSQKLEIISGSINAIKEVNRYNVVFNYPTYLQISENKSEETFLQEQIKKLEKKKKGSGKEFKKRWFENRANLYEPTFIQQFNAFHVNNRQVTVAKNISSTPYTMEIKTTSILAGYDDFFYVEEGEIGVIISIYKKNASDTVLYKIKTTVRGEANADRFERIRTAYGNLGEAVSKHLSRKALLKN